MENGIVILGSGIAGISAGYHLGKNQSIIYEKCDTYGGLCNSFLVNGFLFDTAIHMSFTNIENCREVFDKTENFVQKPEPYNYYYGYWLKHPIQNNLYNLPIDDKVRAIIDFVNKPDQKNNFINYEEWLISNYGSYIAENFPVIYTKKYWTIEAKRLGTSWIDKRMYKPTLEEILHGAFEKITTNVYYAKEMRYPQKGGFKEFLKPMTSNLKMEFHKEAITIDVKKKSVEFSDSTQIYYNSLISSIPLPEIIKIIKDVPLNVRNAANKLLSTSVALISVGFNKIIDAKSTWIYIYDENIVAARAYFPHLKSINNVPSGCSSIQFEVYYSKHNPLDISDDLLKENIIKDIVKMKLANVNDIIFIHAKREKYANVVFETDIYINREIVINYLRKMGIITTGRFGEWDYLWSDQSFMSGMRAANEISNSYR
ncbi:NAD(P)-binding protein [Clostridium bowmanii]|uniref:protoporphyrinogen/coproporphyrinogen oxidase n=1 Tax=Clostridium bowmanii TaxID=132925 RepID=UPI001C0D33C3|nr:NAD(P)-binding protein [Clostridium bowmanii]MBU3190607.1 NAD(P)-binding protein [Clostridium bowmanii]MCA1075140.1 NAD(P)-binding protein [Clostridium bowmanii]